MRKIIALALVFIVFTVTAAAQEFRAGLRQPISTEDTIKSLQDHGRVRLSLSSTIHAFEKICNVEGISNLNLYNKMQGICDVVIRSDVCKDVKKEDLLRCETIDKESQVDLWEFLKGCAQGVLDSIEEILKFLWDILKWVGSHLTSSDAWVKTGDNVSEYSNMAKSYLHSEYEKAYAKSSSPLESVRKIKAAMKMSAAISEMVVGSISNMISNEYKEFGCLNFEAKSNAVCTFIGTVAIPPAGLFALIKYGPVIAAKKFPNIKKAFSNLEKPEPKKSNIESTAEKSEIKAVDRSEPKIEKKLNDLKEDSAARISSENRDIIAAKADYFQIKGFVSSRGTKLASFRGVEVIGTAAITKNLGKKFSRYINDFDNTMEELGFIKPKLTQIIISDKPVFPGNYGPMASSHKAASFDSKAPTSHIFMTPYLQKKAIQKKAMMKDKSVLLHERTHAFLHHTYKKNSFVNRNESVQEALADFFSLHKTGDPKALMDFITKGKPMADIEKRTYFDHSNKEIKLNSLDDFTDIGHYDSLFLSNALWEVRKQLGPKKTSTLLKPFIDNLNQYRDSFDFIDHVLPIHPLAKSLSFNSKKATFINEYQYFLAILKKTAHGTANAKIVDNVINKLIDYFDIPPNNISLISKEIKKSDENFAYIKPVLSKKQESVLDPKLYEVSTATIGGYYIYQVVIPDEE